MRVNQSATWPGNGPGTVPDLVPARLDDLRRSMSAERFSRLLVSGRQSVAEGAASLALAWHQRDLPRLASWSHRLCSAAGTAGMEALQRHTAEVEQAARLGDVDRLVSLMLEIEPMTAAAIAALDAWQGTSDTIVTTAEVRVCSGIG
ncbi:hypothetical protein WCLP8_1190013 [uncultured Gammaproteobacteria bacterium]